MDIYRYILVYSVPSHTLPIYENTCFGMKWYIQSHARYVEIQNSHTWHEVTSPRVPVMRTFTETGALALLAGLALQPTQHTRPNVQLEAGLTQSSAPATQGYEMV